MFCTLDYLRQQVAATCKVDASNLQPPLEALIEPSQKAAYQEIVGELLARGFRKNQIDQWDRGAEFEQDITLFWVLTKGGMLEAFSDLFLTKLDRRKELKTVQVFINGEWTRPDLAPDGPGVIGFGSPDYGSQSGIFNWPDPNDPNLGRPTRW